MAGVTRKKGAKHAGDAVEAAHSRGLRGIAKAAPLRASKRAAGADPRAKTVRASGGTTSAPRATNSSARRTQPHRRPAAEVEQSTPSHDAEIKQLEDLCAALEERAEAAETTLRETVSTISHDLRSPLSVIVVSARMLARSLPQDAPGRRQVDAIIRAADEINQLAQDLVDATNIENGSLRIGKDVHDITPIIDRAVEIIAPIAALKPLEIAKDLPSDLPPISADKDRLVQVLTTLLGSAMRFTPKGGRITVRAELADQGARFSISDTGPGISPEQRPLLFARHTSARRPMGQGTGLAAFVTKGIVEAHGGAIWVESEPGQGSTFFFTIPSAPAATPS